LIVGKLADAIYEGRHGQQGGDSDEDYDYEGGYDGAEDDVETEELEDPNFVDMGDEDAEGDETDS
ncbi:MAG: 30S ribosomal protein S2, partial [Microcoleus sp. Co-bin12]|nr:30S ribosomal protein S2 [Microcoleus sp. Co-bin12]